MVRISVSTTQSLISSTSMSDRNDLVVAVYTLDMWISSATSDRSSGGLQPKSKLEWSMLMRRREVNGITRSRMMQHHHRRLRQFLDETWPALPWHPTAGIDWYWCALASLAWKMAMLSHMEPKRADSV